MSDLLSNLPVGISEELGINLPFISRSPISTPVSPQIPKTIQSFKNKYAPGNKYSAHPTHLYNSLRLLDQQRALQGLYPLTEAQSTDALQSALQNRAITPPPEHSFLENIKDDLGALFSSIPKLPYSLLKEVGEIWTLPQYLPKVKSPADLLRAPGMRLVPGTYTAANVLSGESSQLLKHPLFTALDVLPYANKLAKYSPVVKAAEPAAKLEAARLSEAFGFPIAAKPVRPIQTALTKKLTPEGDIIPSAFGGKLEAFKTNLLKTKPGETFTDAFSPIARHTARSSAYFQHQLQEMMQGKMPDVEMSSIAGAATSLIERHPSITPARRVELTNLLADPVDAAGNPIKSRLTSPSKPEVIIPAVTSNPKELAFLFEAKDLTNRMAVEAQTQYLGPREFGGELYDAATAYKLKRIEKRVQDAEGRLHTKNQAASRIEAILDPANPITVTATRPGGVVYEVPSQALNRTIDLLAPGKSSPIIAKILSNITDGHYSSASTKLRSAMRSPKWQQTFPEGTQAADVLTALAKEKRFMTNIKTTPRTVSSLQTHLQSAVKQSPPARMQPALERILSGRIREYVASKHANDPALGVYLAHIDEGNFKSLISSEALEKNDFYKLRKEVYSTWQELVEEGLDPTFIHRVSPEAASKYLYPTLSSTMPTPSSLKARTLDFTPYIQDFTVALPAQAFEFLRNKATMANFEALGKAFGKDVESLRAYYLPAARAAKEFDPSIPLDSYIDSAIRKDGWEPMNLESLAPLMGKRYTTLEGLHDTWVPASINRNLKRIYAPSMTPAAKAFDPVMGAFRTSVLALSPRWHVYNILGGGLMVALQTDPRVLQFAFKARKMAGKMGKEGSLHDIPGMPPRGSLGMPAEAKHWGKSLDAATKVGLVHAYSSGRFLRRLWDSAASTRARKGFNTVVQKSYDLNGWFDDFYRSLAYLHGQKYGLGGKMVKGLSEAERQAQGIALVRKVMQNWDEITPLERSILRFAFPFYGWMSHVLRTVTSYPFDHPIRTSIMGSFARNELEDFGTGLPQDLMALSFLGEPDKDGYQKAISLRGMNPFTDVANYFTLSGLLGMSNPIISSAAQSLGINTMTGTADLYPNVVYNHETGRLEAAQSNFLSNLLYNTIPQTRTLHDVFFDNAKLKHLLETNPDAAGRMLQSQLGLPVMYRRVNKPQEIYRAELDRAEAQRKAISQAQRTGDYDSLLASYPNTLPYLNQLVAEQSRLKGKGQTMERHGAKPASNVLEALKMSVLG